MNYFFNISNSAKVVFSGCFIVVRYTIHSTLCHANIYDMDLTQCWKLTLAMHSILTLVSFGSQVVDDVSM